MAAKAREARVRNVVHDDAIWRQTIHYEQTTAQNWERCWGFMKEAMIEVCGQFISSPTASNSLESTSSLKPPSLSGLPTKLPPGIALDSDDPILKDWLITYNVPSVVRMRGPIEKYRVPCTTNTEVGWVWGNADEPARPARIGSGDGSEKTWKRFRTLEKFPREAYGKNNILKWWGGGRESMP
ncbi:hypothetical protein DFJ73DRAFT_628555 [Zopfochytrium polystomum]|nr:hypothetical protein DFJ73DRAFT_628555 [Zopfochytrium polystomum]